MTKIQGIYSILHIISGRVYVGSSKDIKKRISTHRSDLKFNRHSNPALQNYYNKYGVESFEFKIIFSAFNVEKLIDIENELIAQINETELYCQLDREKLFNTQWAGKTGCVNPMTYKTGKDHHLFGVTSHNKNKKFSDETKKNMSDGQKGKKYTNRIPLSQSHKDNISSGKAGKSWTQARRDAQKSKN